MPILRLIFLVSAVCFLGFGQSWATTAGEVLKKPAPLTEPMRQAAMPELDDSPIGTILTRYYNEGMGGPEKWAQLESLKVVGTIELERGHFELSAYQKKPNLMKMSIRRPENPAAIELAYNGELAWRSLPGESPEPMEAEEARRFIHSAQFGTHLLHPYARGKTIRFIDTVPVEGAICHHFRVTLEAGYQIDHYIDIRSFLEVKTVNTDLRNGNTHTIIYRDYSQVDEFPVATKVDSYENGEWVSAMRLEELRTNTGVMPWMFDLPE